MSSISETYVQLKKAAIASNRFGWPGPGYRIIADGDSDHDLCLDEALVAWVLYTCIYCPYSHILVGGIYCCNICRNGKLQLQLLSRWSVPIYSVCWHGSSAFLLLWASWLSKHGLKWSQRLVVQHVYGLDSDRTTCAPSVIDAATRRGIVCLFHCA